MVNQILVVEDDFALRSAITASLEISGYEVHACESAEAAVVILSNNTNNDVSNRVTIKPDMVITDLQMGNMSGIDLLKYIRLTNHALPVILMTAYGDVTEAVESMRLGACDYLQKPFEPTRLTKLIENYLPINTNENIIISDPASVQTFEYAKKIAKTNSNVLLSGKSGSGKEVMAKFVHGHSQRSNEQFVAINCAAIPENMLESTLFGYEKGAFTGAHQSSVGKFEQAQGGTLLLDEISEMPLALQAKILRVIQEKEVERLGGKKTIQLDVRIIATTNRDLKEEVSLKRFREDLYYRLNVFPIKCLSLKDRTKDIVPLSEMLLVKYSLPDTRGKLSFSAEAKAKLIGYEWPGNVRELDNLVQRIAVLAVERVISGDEIIFEGDSIDNQLFNKDSTNDSNNEAASSLDDSPLGNDMKHHEYQLIIESLTKCFGKKKVVAEQLGISDRTLRYKIAKMREAGYSIPDKKSFA